MPARVDAILRAMEGEHWAIRPEKLQQFLAILELRAAGGVVAEDDVQAVVAEAEARRGRGAAAPAGVAVIPLYGTIARRATSMQKSSGFASLSDFMASFRAALDDSEVGHIIIDADSPGGTVSGVDEAAKEIFDARSEKRITTVVSGLGCSAMYYLGSSAHEVVVSPSSLSANIGVYTVHIDWSRFLANEGGSATIIKAGRFKAEGSPLEPLSREAREHAQEEINDYYDQFVAAVSRNMGVPEEAVRNGFGEGRALTAKRAVAAGAAHRIATLDEVLSELGVSRKRRSAAARAERPAAPAADATPAAAVEIVSTPPAPAVLGGVAPVVVAAVDVQSDGPAVAVTFYPSTGADGDAPVAFLSPEVPTALDQGKENTMSGVDTAAPAGVVAVGVDALAAERKRAQGISALCAAHGMADKAGAWIEEGISVNAAGARILGLKGEPAAVLPSPQPLVNLTPAENKRYSLTRLINAMAGRNEAAAGFEMEIHQELDRKLGRGGASKGILVPTNLGTLPREFSGVDTELERRAALTTTGSASGKELVYTEPGSFIDMLRTRMVLNRMGATFLPGLQGNVSFPKQTGSGTFEWVPESSENDSGDSDADTGQVNMSPKNGRSITSFSRTLLAQSVINVEQFVRRDLSAITARGIDRAGLHGTGANNQPTGIYNASGVNVVPMGGAISRAKVIAMETAIAEDDADIGAMGYVTTPTVRGAAKNTQYFDGTNGMPLWTGNVENGEMNGYRALASNQLSKTLGTGSNEHGIIFGVWEHVLIGEWGAMEILVDPFTRGGRGLIRVIVFAMVDVAIRYPEAFAKGTGLTAS